MGVSMICELAEISLSDDKTGISIDNVLVLAVDEDDDEEPDDMYIAFGSGSFSFLYGDN